MAGLTGGAALLAGSGVAVVAWHPSLPTHSGAVVGAPHPGQHAPGGIPAGLDFANPPFVHKPVPDRKRLAVALLLF